MPTDCALWTRHYDLGWQPWHSLGGGLASAPAAAIARTGRLHVRVIGTDGATIHERAAITAWEDYSLIDRLPSNLPDLLAEANEPGDAVGDSDEYFAGLRGDEVGRRSGGGEAVVEHGVDERGVGLRGELGIGDDALARAADEPDGEVIAAVEGDGLAGHAGAVVEGLSAEVRHRLCDAAAMQAMERSLLLFGHDSTRRPGGSPPVPTVISEHTALVAAVRLQTPPPALQDTGRIPRDPGTRGYSGLCGFMKYDADLRRMASADKGLAKSASYCVQQ